MTVEKNLAIGTKIELDARRHKDLSRVERSRIIKRTYRVIAVHKHHVLLEDVKTGTKRSITNAELLQMGLVEQAVEQAMLSNY